MGLKIVVAVKQVPDTHNISGDVLNPDGTVNRAALPAIVNPEDLNALEEAVKIKEKIGGTVVAITMGPPNAVLALKECLYRGADDAILISDRKFAGSDTQATSYVLKCAVKKISEKLGGVDLILCGRHSIDGETGQVGPQLAQKLGINQICYVIEIADIGDNFVVAKRAVDGGYETLRSPLPVLMTITADANEPRFPSAKKMMAYKNIGKKQCNGSYDDAYMRTGHCQTIEHITEWSAESVGADPELCGLRGSPTQVKSVQDVVMKADNTRQVPNTQGAISELIFQLVEENVI